jgi:hypothetical protein
LAGQTPTEAFHNSIDPLREALHCVTRQHLTLRERARLTAGPPYTLALSKMDPVPLKGMFPLRVTVGQIVRIVRTDESNAPRGPFKISTVQYLYAFSTPQGQEILGFHWTPEATGANVVTTPHLHIGPAITAGQTALRSGDLHKVHVPTGHVSVKAIVRLAISEFGVEPLRPNWEEVLQRTENASIPS